MYELHGRVFVIWDCISVWVRIRASGTGLGISVFFQLADRGSSFLFVLRWFPLWHLISCCLFPISPFLVHQEVCSAIVAFPRYLH